MTVANKRSRALWLLPPLILVVVIGIPMLLSDALYRRAVERAAVFPFPACEKVWAHRGYAAIGGENTLQSVQAAFERGAAGVEIDILFDDELDDFVVSHDRPYTPVDGKPLRLESILSAHAGNGFLWLDAKDLRKLSPTTARRAVARLATLIKQHGYAQRVFVESSHPLYLSWLTGRGIPASLTISPNDRKYSAAVYRLNAAFMKLAYALSGASAISMDVARYTPTTAATFDGGAVLVSTVNDLGTLQSLSADPRIKVILSDADHYAISACKQ